MGEANVKLDAQVRGTMALYPGITFDGLVRAIATDRGHKKDPAAVRCSLRRLGLKVE